MLTGGIRTRTSVTVTPLAASLTFNMTLISSDQGQRFNKWWDFEKNNLILTSLSSCMPSCLSLHILCQKGHIIHAIIL